METSIEKAQKSSWWLFRVGWYLNVILVIGLMFAAAYFLAETVNGEPEERGPNITMMMGMVTLASILLLGAGVSRYQFMTQGQHHELKTTLTEFKEELNEIKKSVS